MLYVASESFVYFYGRKWFLAEAADFPTTDRPVAS